MSATMDLLDNADRELNRVSLQLSIALSGLELLDEHFGNLTSIAWDTLKRIEDLNA